MCINCIMKKALIKKYGKYDIIDFMNIQYRIIENNTKTEHKLYNSISISGKIDIMDYFTNKDKIIYDINNDVLEIIKKYYDEEKSVKSQEKYEIVKEYIDEKTIEQCILKIVKCIENIEKKDIKEKKNHSFTLLIEETWGGINISDFNINTYNDEQYIEFFKNYYKDYLSSEHILF